MQRLGIDFETYSEADLKKVGPWAYSKHPTTEVLMMAGAFGDDDPQIWLPGDPLPEWTKKIPSEDDRVGYVYVPFIINAWNDFFEYCIMKNVLKWPVPPVRFWHDTAAQAAALALPRGLAECGEALGLPSDKTKDKEGKALITLFSKPKKSTKKGATVYTRTLPSDEPEKFEKFKEYCKQDVVAERAIGKILRPLSKDMRELWELDRKINLRGVRFDVESVKNAIVIRDKEAVKINADVKRTTEGGLENVNSPKQLGEYLKSLGFELENAQKEYLKDFVKDLYQQCEDSGNDGGVIEELRVPIDVLEARLKISKSSLAKYDKLLAILDGDKAYGLLRFHGASTGRWSGNLFQPQNLPRPSFKDTDGCIALFSQQDPEIIQMLYGDVMEALSSCIRGIMTASPGNRLVVSDFSQIESRVLAWLVGDLKKLQGFKDGFDIYKFNASGAFKVDYNKIDDFQRLIGKVMELACGYQGGHRAFQRFADVYGVKIPDKEARIHVDNWRQANPKIVSYWYDIERTAVRAVKHPGSVATHKNVSYKVMGSGNNKFLFCKLPSGRLLAYHRPFLKEGKFGNMQVHFWGVDSEKKKYCLQSTYGGKLVENIAQAVAMDRMAFSMKGLDAAGYPITLTVHDEVKADTPKDHGSLEEFNKIMTTNPPWAEGLPVDAEGYESMRYRK